MLIFFSKKNIFSCILILILNGCGGGGGSSSAGSTSTTPSSVDDLPLTISSSVDDAGSAQAGISDIASITQYNSTRSKMVTTLTAGMSGIIDAIETGSDNFSKRVTAQNLTTNDVKGFTNGMVLNLNHFAKTTLYEHDLMTLEKSFGQQSVLLQSTLNEKEPRVFFLVAGIALTGYFGYQGIVSTIQTRLDPSEKVLQQVTEGSSTHQQINLELGLESDATRTATLDAYQNLGLMEKLNKAHRISEIDLDNPEGSIAANDLFESTASSFQEAGKAALSTEVGFSASATGGQLMDKILSTTGLSGTAAGTVDLAISAAQLQPLDIIANNVTVSAESNTSTTKIIPATSGNMSIQDAKTILTDIANGNLNNIKDVSELESAGAVLAKDIANNVSNSNGVTENSDGSLVVQVPTDTFFQNIDELGSGDSFTITNEGPFDITISGEGKIPEIIEEINPSDNIQLVVNNENLDNFTDDSLLPPTADNPTLVSYISPAQPQAGETIIVYARLDPATPGATINLDISSSDGTNQSISDNTGSAGDVSFEIMGGSAGVTDTVTLSSSTGAESIFSYTIGGTVESPLPDENEPDSTAQYIGEWKGSFTGSGDTEEVYCPTGTSLDMTITVGSNGLDCRDSCQVQGVLHLSFIDQSTGDLPFNGLVSADGSINLTAENEEDSVQATGKLNNGTSGTFSFNSSLGCQGQGTFFR